MARQLPQWFCGALARWLAPALVSLGVFASATSLAGTAVVDAQRANPRQRPPLQYTRYPLRQVAFPYAQHPMQMAPENPPARTPPLLPRITPKPQATPAPSATPAAQQKATAAPVNVTISATAKLESPLTEAFDFFREAAKRADAEPSTGTIFDPTFRPALPPSQPVSSATYRVK